MWKPLRTLGRWLAGTESGPARATKLLRRSGGMQATYDAAQTGSQNRRHWAAADNLGPNTANWSDTRAILRKRARYERDNDPNMNGLGKTLSVDMLGTGPRLQLNVTVDLYEFAGQVSKSFRAWMRAAGMLEKFRLLIEPCPYDGETFGQFVQNPGIAHKIKLDLRVLETEQVATPFANRSESTFTDGIEYDAAGNPTYYHVLKEHPGESIFGTFGQEFDKVPAHNMVHWFRPSRPGQFRGVSEFASSLPGSAQTRRYSQAVLSAAEYAASISGILKTNGSVGNDDSPTFETMEEVDSPNNQLLTVPNEWDVTQLKAEQPTGTYVEFVADKRAESGRPVLAPRNVATGDSSPYNFTSARMDHTVYQRMVWVQRERFQNVVLDKLFRAWLTEAEIKGILPAELGDWREWEWNWHWDGFDEIDPLKETNAKILQLDKGMTTLSEIASARGLDWREIIDQLAIEQAYIEERGVKLGAAVAAIAAPPASDPADEEPDDDDTELAPRNRRPAYAR